MYHAGSFAEAGLAGAFDIAGFPDIIDVVQFCNFLSGPNLIAEGRVNRLSNLSNASFVARWTGTIRTPDGAPVRLTEIYQLRGDAQEPNNSAAWVVDVSEILLH